jgi:TolB-like protein
MSFWAELKRRNVVKVGAAYLIVAWLIAQLVDVINQPLNLPDWFDTTVLVLLGIGFPLAVLFAWIFELTPQGLKVTADVPLEKSIRHLTGQRLNYIVTGLLAAAVLFLGVDRFWLGGDRAPAAALPAAAAPVEPAPTPAAGGADAPRKVAVLPCDNLSPNPNDSYFAAGIHEEILNQLAKIRSLLVVARSSVMQYAQTRPTVPQIARELGANAIMECSVRFAGDDVLVTAQLIDPATDSHLWSETYPGNLSNLSTIFAMQADIAMSIANSLAAEFSPAEQARLEAPLTDSPEAYALYLASRGYNLPPERRLELLEQAVALDPDFAAAHASIAGRLVGATQNVIGASASRTWAEVEARATASAARALALDPNLDVAHAALGHIDLISWRWTAARRNFERALDLNASNTDSLGALTYLELFARDPAAARRHAERMVALLPTQTGPLTLLSLARGLPGDYAEALALCRQVLAVQPGNLLCNHGIGHNLVMLGDPGAEAQVRQVERLLGSNRLLAVLAPMSNLYARLGETEDVARLVAEVETRGRDANIGAGMYASLYAAAGDRTKVREQLEIVLGKIEREEPDAGFFELINVRNNAYGNPLLEEPEFRALRDRLAGR